MGSIRSIEKVKEVIENVYYVAEIDYRNGIDKLFSDLKNKNSNFFEITCDYYPDITVDANKDGNKKIIDIMFSARDAFERGTLNLLRKRCYTKFILLKTANNKGTIKIVNRVDFNSETIYKDTDIIAIDGYEKKSIAFSKLRDDLKLSLTKMYNHIEGNGWGIDAYNTFLTLLGVTLYDLFEFFEIE